MTSFLERVENAIHDSNLQTVLSSTTSRLRQKRSDGFASLSHPETIRDAARQAKMEVLANLDKYLLDFEEQLIKHNVNVHWAENGADANEIVVNIAKNADVKHIVKSKSMVTEEIHLNRALEENGLQVRETDLGEYIVQLAGDQPSHIVMPIIHMNSAGVGKLMQEKLDAEYSDDPQQLARIARKTLREEFQQADMGITGANFGVAETGTICVVTNEGNARMVTTLPRIHVVIMGIEKLVPSLSELDTMLKLLARSATGQKLTVYTSLFHGPRQAGETDGPEEMHVILLDNGRSQALSGDAAEILACIRCGACLNACPVFAAIGGHAYGTTYPGPVGKVVTPALRGIRPWHELPSASTLCGACRDICPLRLDIPRMLLSLRRTAIEISSPAPLTVAMKLFSFFATKPKFYHLAASFIRKSLTPFTKNRWIKKGPPPLKGWTLHRDFPQLHKMTFQKRWMQRHEKNKS